MSKIFSRFGRPSCLSLVGAMALGAMSTSALAQQWKVVVLDPPGAGALGVWGNVQVGTNTASRALMWTGTPESVIDLTPSVADYGNASAVFGDRQVGHVSKNGDVHAALWFGSAASFVDLDPQGSIHSKALGAWGTQQVGGFQPQGLLLHAALWSGSAASMIVLHPNFLIASEALAAGDGQQVGWSRRRGDDPFHACMWRGTAESFVDLHPNGWNKSWARGVSGDHQVGWVGTGSTTTHAVMWNGSAASWADLTPPGQVAQALGGTYGFQVGTVGVRAWLWSGTAESYVDLSTSLPADMNYSSAATGAWTDGTTLSIVGHAVSGSGGYHAVLWTLDLVGPPCPADFDLDGTLDFFDYDAFVVCFEGSCPQERTADFNGDGTVDFNDYDAFVTAFEAGC